MVIGSSPRLRGTHFVPPREWVERRFIPAPAGNTGGGGVKSRLAPVHPRACGEHATTSKPRLNRGGSSPRLRGTPGSVDRRSRSGRFIPAPAGNTGGGKSYRRWRPVHPRACGEHHRNRPNYPNGLGSSPRLRGTRWRLRATRLLPRFIPAPAGNTSAPGRRGSPPSVHPRACGEHTCSVFQASHADGSSPRLRGTQRAAVNLLQRDRFIPAPAGNTPPALSRRSRLAVHPRACGEHIRFWTH